MKTKRNILVILTVIGFCSCEINQQTLNGTNFDSFCSSLPDGWSCEVYQDSFDSLPIPYGDQSRLENPLAIVKYTNSTITCSDSNPFWLQVYEISKKDTLEIVISNSQMYSWCIPIFFGENEEYYVITSPCYLYSRCWTENNINPLLQELKGLFTNSIID